LKQGLLLARQNSTSEPPSLFSFSSETNLENLSSDLIFHTNKTTLAGICQILPEEWGYCTDFRTKVECRNFKRCSKPEFPED
jgi:hypothetical protein